MWRGGARSLPSLPAMPDLVGNMGFLRRSWRLVKIKSGGFSVEKIGRDAVFGGIGSHTAAACFVGNKEDEFFKPIDGGLPALQKVSEQHDAACSFDAWLVENGFSPKMEKNGAVLIRFNG
ncbi:hypothetical protein ACLOJK_035404 [Asimina triloba]